MKNREGFISIIALIVMTVLLMMSLYLEYTSRLEYLILNATANNTQSYYLSEGKILMSIYDKDYYNNQLYPILTKAFRNTKFGTITEKILINNNDLEENDTFPYIRLGFRDKDSRKELVLTSESNYNGIHTKVISYVNIVNEIFEIDNAILSKHNIDNKFSSEFEELLESISNEISLDFANIPLTLYGIEANIYDDIILSNIDPQNYEISCHRESMLNPYVERFDKNQVLIIIKGIDDKKTNLYIGDCNDPEDLIKLNGVLFVQGDILISSNFEFHGIIVIKDGEIIANSPEKPKINGKIISYRDIDLDYIEEAISLNHNQPIVYKYGSYLPSFFECNIKLIKSAN